MPRNKTSYQQSNPYTHTCANKQDFIPTIKPLHPYLCQETRLHTNNQTPTPILVPRNKTSYQQSNPYTHTCAKKQDFIPTIKPLHQYLCQVTRLHTNNQTPTPIHVPRNKTSYQQSNPYTHTCAKKQDFIPTIKPLHSYLCQETRLHTNNQTPTPILVPRNKTSYQQSNPYTHTCANKQDFIPPIKPLHPYLCQETRLHTNNQTPTPILVPRNKTSYHQSNPYTNTCAKKQDLIPTIKPLHPYLCQETRLHTNNQTPTPILVPRNKTSYQQSNPYTHTCAKKQDFIPTIKPLHQYLCQVTRLHTNNQTPTPIYVPRNKSSYQQSNPYTHTCAKKQDFIPTIKPLHSYLCQEARLHTNNQTPTPIHVPRNKTSYQQSNPYTHTCAKKQDFIPPIKPLHPYLCQETRLHTNNKTPTPILVPRNKTSYQQSNPYTHTCAKKQDLIPPIKPLHPYLCQETRLHTTNQTPTPILVPRNKTSYHQSNPYTNTCAKKQDLIPTIKPLHPYMCQETRPHTNNQTPTLILVSRNKTSYQQSNPYTHTCAKKQDFIPPIKPLHPYLCQETRLHTNNKTPTPILVPRNKTSYQQSNPYTHTCAKKQDFIPTIKPLHPYLCQETRLHTNNQTPTPILVSSNKTSYQQSNPYTHTCAKKQDLIPTIKPLHPYLCQETRFHTNNQTPTPILVPRNKTSYQQSNPYTDTCAKKQDFIPTIKPLHPY